MKKQGRIQILLKGFLVFCLLASHFQGVAMIAQASTVIPDNTDMLESTETDDSQGEANQTDQSEQTDQEENEDSESTDNVGNQDEETEEIESNEEVISPDEDTTLDSDTSDETTLISEELSTEESSELSSLEPQNRAIGSGLVEFSATTASGAATCSYNHDLKPNGGKNKQETYINACYVKDALYLGEDTNYYYVYVSGYEGKVLKSTTTNGVTIAAKYIPANGARAVQDGLEPTEPLDVRTLDYTDQLLVEEGQYEVASYANDTVNYPSYYANENGALVHYITKGVVKSSSSSNYDKIIIGVAPNWMSQGYKYYSYDGVYFYNHWSNIRVNGQGAVNEKNPFYNYYQYLSFRSMSNYNAQALDNYTNNNGGSGGKLVDSGQYFAAVKNKYGVNGTLQYAMGIHESAFGKSTIAMNKNNLFGINAVDSNPGDAANFFQTVEDCINVHAQRHISWAYTDPIDDWKYFGAHVGNKGSGMNVKYASDPFWGEKIAAWYYRIDKSNGMKDYNAYTIGVKTSDAVINVYSQSNTSSTVLYQTKNKKSNLTIADYPFVIVGEEGDFYKVQTDTPIVNNKPSYGATYNWDNSKGYVLKSSINYTNKALSGWINDMGTWYYYKDGSKVTGWMDIDGYRYYFDNSGKMQKGWLQLNNIWYYLNGSGEMQTGFVQVGNDKYYFNSNGEMQTGWVQIGDKKYYFNASGHMQFGWLQLGTSWYYLNSAGEMQTGWVQIGNDKYYFNGNGERQTGWVQVGNDKYYFNNDGKMQTGWLQLNNKWYYLNQSGQMQTGWLQLNNKKYYLNNDGVMLTGWQTIGGKKHFFWESGSMAIGWVDCPDGWYYTNSAGEMQTGWIELSGKTYYLNENGKMHSGWLKSNDNWYFFWESGSMVKGWLELSDGWYYMSTSGIMQKGWQTIGGKKYYFYSSGLMAKGTTVDGYKIDLNGVATKK